MGYKKLDEVMELLTDELDGFNKSIDRLKHLVENVDNVEVEATSWEIQKIIREHLEKERLIMESIERKIKSIDGSISRAKIIPKTLIWIMVALFGTSLVTLCFLSLKIAFLDDIREKSYELGRQEVIVSLKGYFDENPEMHKSYEAWRLKGKETDSVRGKK